MIQPVFLIRCNSLILIGRVTFWMLGWIIAFIYEWYNYIYIIKEFLCWCSKFELELQCISPKKLELRTEKKFEGNHRLKLFHFTKSVISVIKLFCASYLPLAVYKGSENVNVGGSFLQFKKTFLNVEWKQ